MKIVVLDGYAANPGDIGWAELFKLGDVTVYDRTPPELVVERIGNAEAVLMNKVIFTEQIFESCPKLKYIGIMATGYNIIDLSAASSHAVTVCNVPAYSTPSVVQHSFALLLELCSRTGQHAQSVAEGRWNINPDFCYCDTPLVELCGKTMGLIGFGQIGKGVAKVAVSFGMNVLACASHPRSSSEIDGVSYTDLDEVLKSSDIISLHCPLTSDNAGLICFDTISKMKDGAIIINTARGGLVNEADVAEALYSGKLSGYAADVLTDEPPVNGSPLIGAPNCILTPHIAWAPLESRRRLITVAVDNLKMFIEGNPQNVVNKK